MRDTDLRIILLALTLVFWSGKFPDKVSQGPNLVSSHTSVRFGASEIAILRTIVQCSSLGGGGLGYRYICLKWQNTSLPPPGWRRYWIGKVKRLKFVFEIPIQCKSHLRMFFPTVIFLLENVICKTYKITIAQDCLLTLGLNLYLYVKCQVTLCQSTDICKGVGQSQAIKSGLSY